MRILEGRAEAYMRWEFTPGARVAFTRLESELTTSLEAWLGKTLAELGDPLIVEITLIHAIANVMHRFIGTPQVVGQLNSYQATENLAEFRKRDLAKLERYR